MRPEYIQVPASAGNGKEVAVERKYMSTGGQYIISSVLTEVLLKQKPSIDQDRILRIRPGLPFLLIRFFYSMKMEIK